MPMCVGEETKAAPSILGRRLVHPGHESGRVKPFRFAVKVRCAGSPAELTQTTATAVLQAPWHAGPAAYEVTCGLKAELTALLDTPHFKG